MPARKTPILLRRSPFSDEIVAIHKYTKNGDRITAALDGKQDVSRDFYSLLLEELIPDAKSNITAALDGAARGLHLNDAERQEISEFRKRLVKIIERHNARLDREKK